MPRPTRWRKLPQGLISTQYIESLVSKNGCGCGCGCGCEIIPRLATEWTPSDDGLTWDFTLRDNVTFTDGTPFNAE